ncbi:Glucose-1-phosphate adenylyltransferase [subsurface metagenome]
MKQISVLVIIKENEPGLLSIADNREKSLVQVFDRTKIIDCYLRPFDTAGFSRLSVITDRDMTAIKDYVSYTYSSHKIKIVNESDVFRSLCNVLNLHQNECILILRADGLLFPDWINLKNFLLNLPNGNYELITPQRNIIGYFLHNTKFIQKLKGTGSVINQRDSKVDSTWEVLEGTLHASTESVEFKTLFIKLETVFDYFTVHFSLRHHLEQFIRKTPPSSVLNEEDLTRITGTGFVKNSHVSTSCIIEGYVERSILFSHVKVGKSAHIINSIIMDNNFIGGGAVIQNAIVCDNGELFSRVTPNIGEDARIGEDDSTGANVLYPEFIHGGITLIGQNVEIPKGFKISRNCFIASNVDKSILKGWDKVKAGDSVLHS